MMSLTSKTQLAPSTPLVAPHSLSPSSDQDVSSDDDEEATAAVQMESGSTTQESSILASPDYCTIDIWISIAVFLDAETITDRLGLASRHLREHVALSNAVWESMIHRDTLPLTRTLLTGTSEDDEAVREVILDELTDPKNRMYVTQLRADGEELPAGLPGGPEEYTDAIKRQRENADPAWRKKELQARIQRGRHRASNLGWVPYRGLPGCRHDRELVRAYHRMARGHMRHAAPAELHFDRLARIDALVRLTASTRIADRQRGGIDVDSARRRRRYGGTVAALKSIYHELKMEARLMWHMPPQSVVIFDVYALQQSLLPRRLWDVSDIHGRHIQTCGPTTLYEPIMAIPSSQTLPQCRFRRDRHVFPRDPNTGEVVNVREPIEYNSLLSEDQRQVLLSRIIEPMTAMSTALRRLNSRAKTDVGYTAAFAAWAVGILVLGSQTQLDFAEPAEEVFRYFCSSYRFFMHAAVDLYALGTSFVLPRFLYVQGPMTTPIYKYHKPAAELLAVGNSFAPDLQVRQDTLRFATENVIDVLEVVLPFSIRNADTTALVVVSVMVCALVLAWLASEAYALGQSNARAVKTRVQAINSWTIPFLISASTAAMCDAARTAIFLHPYVFHVALCLVVSVTRAIVNLFPPIALGAVVVQCLMLCPCWKTFALWFGLHCVVFSDVFIRERVDGGAIDPAPDTPRPPHLVGLLFDPTPLPLMLPLLPSPVVGLVCQVLWNRLYRWMWPFEPTPESDSRSSNAVRGHFAVPSSAESRPSLFLHAADVASVLALMLAEVPLAFSPVASAIIAGCAKGAVGLWCSVWQHYGRIFGTLEDAM